MTKRNLFDELMEGMEALQAEREGKVTLKRVTLPSYPEPQITSNEIITLRQTKNLSRSVFAHVIRTNPRTLESWEQGRSKPNAQATLLLRLVEKYPETLEHLKTL